MLCCDGKCQLHSIKENEDDEIIERANDEAEKRDHHERCHHTSRGKKSTFFND